MSKILLVEDEVSLQDLYAEVLTEAGYSVLQVGDGETALVEIQKGDWDLLLLDIMLPKLDGLEVLREISSNNYLGSKPVIIISNLEDNAVIKEAYTLGACDFLIKSNLMPSDILDSANKHLAND